MLGDMDVAVNSLRSFTFKFTDASEYSGRSQIEVEKQGSKIKRYSERTMPGRGGGRGREVAVNGYLIFLFLLFLL